MLPLSFHLSFTDDNCTHHPCISKTRIDKSVRLPPSPFLTPLTYLLYFHTTPVIAHAGVLTQSFFHDRWSCCGWSFILPPLPSSPFQTHLSRVAPDSTTAHLRGGIDPVVTKVQYLPDGTRLWCIWQVICLGRMCVINSCVISMILMPWGILYFWSVSNAIHFWLRFYLYPNKSTVLSFSC